MKSPTTGNKASAKRPAVGFGHQNVYRRNLALRGEEKLQQTTMPSNMAEQLQMMEEHVAKTPVVDFHRRNMIRNAIVTGTYTIDPMSIATKFLQFEKGLYS